MSWYLFILWCIVCLYIIKRRFCYEVTKLYYKRNSINEKLIKDCKSIRLYEYPIWGFSGTLQTFYAQGGRYHTKPTYRREYLDANDGGLIVLDHVLIDGVALSDSSPIVIIVPGICSTSNSHYIRHFGQYCAMNGFRAVIYLPRGCAELKSPKIFTLGGTNDIRQAIDHLHNKYPNSIILGSAFSLGGNVMIRYLGECGRNNENPILIGAVTMAQGYDAVNGINHLKSIPFYDRGLTRKLIGLLKRHSSLFNGVVDVEYIIQNVKSVEDFDRHFTCKIYGYQSPRDYYEDHSCYGYIQDINIPILLMNSNDDPLVSPRYVPIKISKQHDKIIHAITDHGGHLGWVEGFIFPNATHWNERVAIEYLNSLLSLYHKKLL